MPSIGPEWIIVLIVALLVLGPKRLPEVGSALGKTIREFRQGMSEVKDATNLTETPSSTAAPTVAQTPPVTPAPAPAAAPLQTAPPTTTAVPDPSRPVVAAAAGVELTAAPLPPAPEPTAA